MKKGTRRERDGNEAGASAPAGGAAVAEATREPQIDLSGLTVEPWPLDRVREHPNNPRVPDPADIAVMAASIAVQGQLQPAILRRSDGLLIAGHRRLWALRRLGRTSIDVVAIDCTDEESRALLLGSNLHAAPSAIAEAAVLEQLLDHGRRTVREVADALGWTLARTERRRQLGRLTTQARRRFEAEWKQWPIEAAEAFAMLEPDLQDAVLAEGGDPDLQDEVSRLGFGAVEDLRPDEVIDIVREQQQVLRAAPFALEDATLIPKAGPCFEPGGRCCPKSSIARPGLFDAQVEGDPRTARCMDRACWRMKTDETIRRRIAEARERTPDLVVVATTPDAVKPLAAGVPLVADYAARQVAKGSRGAVPALRVTTGGKVEPVFIAPTSAAVSSAAAKPKTADKSPAQRLRDSRDAIHRRRLAWAIDGVASHVDGRKDAPRRDVLLRLVAVFEVSHPLHGEYEQRVRDAKDARRHAALIGRDWDQAVWKRLRRALRDALRRNNAELLERDAGLAEWLAGEIGVDWGVLMVEAERDIPNPKWWPVGTVAGPAAPVRAATKRRPIGKAAAAGDDAGGEEAAS